MQAGIALARTGELQRKARATLREFPNGARARSNPIARSPRGVANLTFTSEVQLCCSLACGLREQNSHDRRCQSRRFAARAHQPDQLDFNHHGPSRLTTAVSTYEAPGSTAAGFRRIRPFT
jgi:hypothetical protein